MSDLMLAVFGGAALWGLFILLVCGGGLVGAKATKQKYYFKCVEMREMPLGACSRLFGEK